VLREHEVAGSNPVAPTEITRSAAKTSVFAALLFVVPEEAGYRVRCFTGLLSRPTFSSRTCTISPLFILNDRGGQLDEQSRIGGRGALA
jgi:hypothetical protein